MAGPFPLQANPGAFVPTTDNYDTSLIYSLNINSTEFKEFLVRLRQSVNSIALVLNVKDSGYFVDQEFLDSRVWYPDPTLSSSTATSPSYRQEFRKVVIFGTLPNTGTKSVAHGLTITAGYRFKNIQCVANDPIAQTYIPIPFASVGGADNIQITVDATNINISTASNRTNYTDVDVVLEYIKT